MKRPRMRMRMSIRRTRIEGEAFLQQSLRMTHLGRNRWLMLGLRLMLRLRLGLGLGGYGWMRW